MSEIILKRAAYINNLDKICAKSGGKERVILVLKDNAYGHGAQLIAKEASGYGIKFCAVKDEREADDVGQYFAQTLILSHRASGTESQSYIYGANDIENLAKFKRGTKIHLAIDTLMHRNGVGLEQIALACEIIKQNELKLLGAYTHFRSADELNSDYFVQRAKFNEAKELIVKFSGIPSADLNFHSHNSAGLERFGALDDELVRVGIAQYGYAQFSDELGLKRVLELWAHRISQRTLKSGQSVGYGAKFSASADMQIAAYDLGYADGLLRYGGVGELNLASGVPMLGKMSMDSFSAPNVGDKICLFDDARVWAKFFDTIEYDVLVKLSPNIARKFV